MDLPKRKRTRLENFDYNTAGVYFLTLCAKERALLFGRVETDECGENAVVCLSPIGEIAERYIRMMGGTEYARMEKYVIMPNHIHLLVYAQGEEHEKSSAANAAVPKLVSGFKRLVNRAAGQDVFQRSYFDHIVRGDEDYRMIWQYIEQNPAKWREDRFWMGEQPEK